MIHKITNFLLGAILLLTAVIAPAQAQASSTWLPSFDRGTHVYVDPALSKHPSYPVTFSGMEKEVNSLSTKHGIDVYVVATERDFDPNRVIAAEIAEDLVARWSGRSDFSKEKFLVIVWVRQETNPNKGSVAAYAGNKLQGYGFTKSRMNDRVYGPVIPALKQYMPQDPQQAMLQVIRNVNTGVDQAIAAAKQAEQDRIEAAKRAEQDRIAAEKRAEQDRIEAEHRAVENARRAEQMKTIALYGLPSLALIGLLIFLTLRFRRTRARASEVLEKSRTELQNAGHWYVQLEEAYLGFLKRQTDWQKRFDPKGKTAKQFAEAVGWYANLTTRKLAAADMFERAEKSFNSARWPLTGGLERTIAILTVEEVTVSDRNLSIEEAELFKGLVVETKYAPAELLANMEELFAKTNKALAQIKKAFEGAAQNRQDIAQLLAEVEALKSDGLAKAGLSFKPYEGRHSQIARERDAVLALIDKDPLSAFAGSEEVEEKARLLKADIEHAIKLSGSLAQTAKEVEDARKRVSDVRAANVGYNYPEKAGSDDRQAGEKFLLAEHGFNPDNDTQEAALRLADARAALLDGKLELAEKMKAASSAASAKAVALVEEILNAKVFVEKQVLPVRQNLTRLQSELPEAGKKVDALKADFLAKNYAGEPEKLVRAQKVADSTEAELAKVRKAYFEQSFMSSRRLLENVGGEISNSRGKLVEIATRLLKLIDLRAHARKVIAESEQFAATLKSKLSANSFTTSRGTDEAYVRLLPMLKTQKADVAKDVTDWPEAAANADKLAAEFKKIDGAIDTEKKAYELAGTRIAELRAAIYQATSAVANPDTRTAARRKLDDATRAYAEVEAEYKVAKSDWNTLARKVESKKELASAAQKAAEADHRLANQARRAIDEVESRIRALAIRSFTQTVSWRGYSQVISLATVLDLSEANRHVGAAASDLRNRDYEGAIEAAKRADRSADKAEEWANAQLALMAQELISRWQAEERRKEEERRRREEEERRRREEEDRRRRQEEEDRRRRDDNNSGGGNYGGGAGGGNYGGGGAGGGNY